MIEDYKEHEDNKQERYLDYFSGNSNEMLTSCRHLSRRMLHSWNWYSYTCEANEEDGCPKAGSGRKWIADKSCFCDPYSIRLGSDNSDDGEFKDK